MNKGSNGALKLSREPSSSVGPCLTVLIVVEPGLDGVFRHVEGLVGFLLSRNVRLHLAYSSPRSGLAMLELVERVRQSGGTVVDLGVTNIPKPSDLLAFYRLTRIVFRVRPDVVHAHSSKAGALVRFLGMFYRRPRYIYTPHAYYGLAKPSWLRVRFFNWIERLLGGVGTTIAISRDEADFARRTLNVAPHRIAVIHNPVDAARFVPATAATRRSAREKLGIAPDAIVLATIGRMCWQKDPETAYQAVSPVCAQNPPLHFFHLGWGHWKSYLLELSQKLGYGNQLRILDYVEDPRTFYAAIDAVLISSRYEAGWPLVLLESLACNLPVVTATCLGMSDIRQAGLTHLWTFLPEDVAGCTEQVQQWLLRHRRAEILCNHRQFAIDRLSPDRCYSAVHALYSGIMPVSGVSPLPTETIIP